MTKQTKEQKLAKKREWYYKNIESVKLSSKKSREKHKEQRRLDTKLWLEKNKEYSKIYHKEYHKKWYQENKEKRDTQNIQWVKNNPEKIKKIKDNFKKNHPDSSKKYLKDYQVTLKGKYRTMKGGGLKRNYEVKITFDEFKEIVSNPCVYCGETEKRIGIDRVDNTKGYTTENSAPCCTTCNMMKKTMTVEQFLQHIRKIHNHNIINLKRI